MQGRGVIVDGMQKPQKKLQRLGTQSEEEKKNLVWFLAAVTPPLGGTLPLVCVPWLVSRGRRREASMETFNWGPVVAVAQWSRRMVGQ